MRAALYLVRQEGTSVLRERSWSFIPFLLVRLDKQWIYSKYTDMYIYLTYAYLRGKMSLYSKNLKRPKKK